MNRTPGIIYLAGDKHLPEEIQQQMKCSAALVFEEDGRSLSRAQEALWKIRNCCNWVCVAAEGSAGITALALAAQLPVNRIVLRGNPFERNGIRPGREEARLRAYARRNMALIVSEVLFAGVAADQAAALARCMPHASCRIFPPETEAEIFTAQWNALPEKTCQFR